MAASILVKRNNLLCQIWSEKIIERLDKECYNNVSLAAITLINTILKISNDYNEILYMCVKHLNFLLHKLNSSGCPNEYENNHISDPNLQIAILEF